MALYIVKPWYKKQAAPAPIYGAEWAGGSDPSWVRTDAAANFADPNPYYSRMSGTPSSLFDNIMPWGGMRRVTDSSAGELVEIPKFYYKWTRDGAKMKLQISTQQHTGFLCSPAHADRGDGAGERDYVYVGRYHCSSSNYKSASGVKPKASITRATARTAIHNLGSNVWQFDFALWWTINMLYLVEFANWNSQACIGYGCGNDSSVANNGATDTMPYHTGTMKSSRTTYGVGIQYRYIEDWWANVRDFVDGIYFSGDNIYCTKNPANFSDSSGGTLSGQRATIHGYTTAWNNPTASGFEYALYPSAANDSLSGDTYITDHCGYNSNSTILVFGGAHYQLKGYGMFHLGGDVGQASYTSSAIGARLMVLPPDRLSS